MTQRGFTLLELLIALAVVSFGLLGIAALQIVGVRSSGESYVRSQGSSFINELAERMHANQVAIADGDYVVNMGTDFECEVPAAICEHHGSTEAAPNGFAPDDCTPAQMATYDTYAVFCGRLHGNTVGNGGIRQSLPNPTLEISCVQAGCPRGSRYNIELTWEARETDQDDTADMDGDGDNRLQTKTINLNFLP